MGLFNFLYKLTNIFSNKRKLKVFIVLGLILFIVFSWSRGVFAVEPTPSDSMALTNYQLALQDSMVSYLRNMYQTKPAGYNAENFNAFMNLFRYHFCFVQPSSNPNELFNVYFYNPGNTDNNPNIFTTDATWSIGLNSGTQFPCKIGLITPRYTGTISLTGDNNRPTPTYISYGTDVYMPSDFYCVRSISINDFLKELGKYSSLATTYTTHDQELQAVTQSGFNNLNNTLQTQTQTMTNSINSATNSITNSVDNLTNTISDTATDDSQVQFAQDSNQDTTSGFFTGLFNSFQTAFTDNSYKYVQFPIPFTGKVITFSSTYVRDNIKNNQSFSVIVSLAEAFWWFALGYFVILDIYKKINAIKSGDLTNIENDNITTDLL